MMFPIRNAQKPAMITPEIREAMRLAANSVFFEAYPEIFYPTDGSGADAAVKLLNTIYAALTAALALHKPAMPGENTMTERIEGYNIAVGDSAGGKSLTPPEKYTSQKPCCTICDRKKVCHVCGDQTLMACSDCAINFGVPVYVCGKRACREEHERRCFSKPYPLSPVAMPEGLPEGPWVAVPDYHNGWTVITDDGQGTTVAAKLREAIARAIAFLPDLYTELAKAIAMADELWIAREQIRGELDAARNKTIEECAQSVAHLVDGDIAVSCIRALATGETKPSEDK